MTEPGRRLLTITYYFPPETSVGAHRWRAMSRWLRRLGHEVTVLTTRAFGLLPEDDAGTRRTPDLAASPPLRGLLRRPRLPTAGASPAATAPTDSLRARAPPRSSPTSSCPMRTSSAGIPPPPGRPGAWSASGGSTA